uniref:Maturase K n=1 Tax=Netrium digitus TaxID=43946 RepID=A0A191T572_9VIRI|nr:maturase K [Netrium digitus]ANI25548.1 maturase K [Netrium digitus]
MWQAAHVSFVKQQTKTFSKLSFLTVKRSIEKMRHHTVFSYRKVSSVQTLSGKLLGKSVFRSISTYKLILQILPFLFIHKNRYGTNKFLNNLFVNYRVNYHLDINPIYSSVHWALAFIEKNWQCCNSVLEKKISLTFHPESIIRIIRQTSQDASFLHMLRRILYSGLVDLKLEYPFSFLDKKKAEKLAFVLWNMCLIEFDIFVVDSISKLFNTSLKKNHNALLNNISSLRKFKDILPISFFVQEKDIVSYNQYFSKKIHIECIFDDLLHTKNNFFATCHYIRYANNCVLASQNGDNLMLFFKKGCLRFWNRRIGLSYTRSMIHKTFLSNNSHFFLGYCFRIKTSIIKPNILTQLVLGKSLLKKKSIYASLPLNLLLLTLNKHKFCNAVGNPVAKTSWSILEDIEIINRFRSINISLINYYNASRNRKGLLRIQYILRYSCGKTLAYKHKTGLRFIWTNYSINLFYRSFPRKYNNLSESYLLLTHKKKRLWNLHINRPDPFGYLINQYKID